MKRSFKVAVLCFFAVLLAGCLPQQKLTGRVMDTAGPVPGAAVLAMVWIEDAGKALPAPDIRNLAQMDLDIILQKDMKNRGLPAAYARAFTDENGRFDLDTLHFSAETKTAVKVMAQPKISRITLNAFQRGYLKHAATVFPKDISKELSPAVVRLSKPESWKQLALDNPYRTLRRDEYDQGYSKEFGATKAEKKWFLDYISSNLNEAYQASNIKGDKQWEEDCGRDFSDIVISSSGMQRNPNHEKCNELLREMGVLRDWEKLWVDHSYAPDARQTPAINAIKEAVNALEPEFAEIKQYEAQIIAGAEEAAKEYTAQAQKNLRDGLSEASPLPPEAQSLYRNGDKAGAYKALGHALYSGLPAELKQGIVTAMLPTITLPRIKETTVGFYLFQNRPLTAQLPNGDNGNHKDKPKVEVEKSTEVGKNYGTRIIHAEKELIVSEDGKVLRHELVSSWSKRTREVYREAEIENKKGRKLRITEQELKPSKLLFYDKDGKKIRELVLDESPRNVVKKKHVLLNSERPIAQDVSYTARASESGKYALYVESVMEYELADDNLTAQLYLGETSAFKYYSSDGKVLFERRLSPAYSVWGTAISDDGEVLVVTKGCEVPDLECPDVGGEEEDNLLVYNARGEKILGHESALTNLVISPRGKYLAGSLGDNIFFFNTQNNKTLKKVSESAVSEIGDTGLVRLTKSVNRGKELLQEEFDLTKYLGD